MKLIYQKNTLHNGSPLHYSAQPICDHGKNVLGYEVCTTIHGLHVEKFVSEASPELLLNVLISQMNFVKYYSYDDDKYWSFNLDPRILYKSNLVDELVLHTQNLPFSCVLEITENHELPEKGITEATLAKLKSNGSKIFLDDFGSAYSNVEVLNSYDFDGLKLDKSLLLNVSSDKNSHANLEKLFNLIVNSQFECVVEGVETSQELEILTRIGFSRFQGYFLGKPFQFADLFVESRKLSD